MYVVLVSEPGSDIQDYVLPTGAHSSDGVLSLMQSRAEEWIEEELAEASLAQNEPTEGYNVNSAPDLLSVTVVKTSSQRVCAEFTAVAIDRVVD